MLLSKIVDWDRSKKVILVESKKTFERGKISERRISDSVCMSFT